MKKAFSSLLLFLLFLLALPNTVIAFGNQPGSVRGLTAGNSHLVVQREGRVYRGAEPKKNTDNLIEFGITDVLIIKNSTRGEVEKEIAALQTGGMSKARITHIPLTWSAAGQLNNSCTQIIEALAVIQDALKKKGRQLYFHCTAGEDRTGAVAGLTRMLEEGISAQQAWQDDLCAHGYAEGDENKPASVNKKIHANLTPVFVHLATAIENGELSRDHLDQSVCDGKIDTRVSKWSCR